MHTGLHHLPGLCCQPPRRPKVLQSHSRPQVTCSAGQRRPKGRRYTDADADSRAPPSKSPGSSLDISLPWWEDSSGDSGASSSSSSNSRTEQPASTPWSTHSDQRQDERPRGLDNRNGRDQRDNHQRGGDRNSRGSRSGRASDQGRDSMSSGSRGRGRGGGHSTRSRPSFADALDDRSVHRRDDSDDDEDEDEEGPGWWEVPREQRNAPVAAAQYEPWQLEKLEVAFLRGKRRVQVQALAADLGMDRVEVLEWFKAFGALPTAERNRRLKPRAPLLEQQLHQEQQQKEREQKRAQERQQQRQQQQAAETGMPGVSPWEQQQQPLPLSRQAGPNTGFIPFYERKDAAAAATSRPHRRLSAEALRMLEAVYARTPYPPRDVVQGLYELHRINRDAALEWFTARRDLDGRPHNPRAAKRAAEAAGNNNNNSNSSRGGWDQAPSAAAGDYGGSGSDESAQRSELMALFGGDGMLKPAVAAPVKRTVALTQRELAQLRSSLPSPNKRKGVKLAEQLAIKQGEVAGQMEVGGITFVAQDGAQRWRGVWRRRRAQKGLPGNFLDYRRWLKNLSAQHREATSQQAALQQAP